MPNNVQYFQDLLKTQKVLTEAQISQRNAAYDALIQASTETNAFNTAIKAHIEFWKILDPNVASGIVNLQHENALVVDPQANVDPAALFTSLRQTAIEQRILFGLQNAPRDVLVAVLTNNPAECRAYLAGKPETFGPLSSSEGWQQTVTPQDARVQPPESSVAPNPINPSTNVLSDQSIKRIQQEAVLRHLNMLVRRTNVDYADVQALVNAPDKAALIRAAEKLQFPETKSAHLELLSAENKATLKGAWARVNFLKYVQSMPKKTILTLSDALDSGNFTRVTSMLEAPFNSDLLKTDKSFVIGNLAIKFIQMSLLENPNQVKSLLNSNATEFKDQLRKIFHVNPANNNSFVDGAIATDVSRLKRDLVNNLILNLGDSPEDFAKLQNINKAKNLKDLKTALEIFEIDTTWLQAHDVQALQQTSLHHSFMHLLDNTSRFKSGAHQPLSRFFDRLNSETQQVLLRNSTEVHHLLNATTAEEIARHLGIPLNAIPTADMENLLDQNKRYALFKQIHNARIAEILEESKAIELDESRVLTINQLIDSANWDEFGNDNLKTLIDQIAEVCEIDPNIGLYTKFELEAAEDGFILKGLKEQASYNKGLVNLIAEYPQNFELINKMLSFNKTAAFTTENAKTIITHFNNSSNLQSFFSAIPNNPAFKDIKTSLIRDLTGDEFTQMKQSVSTTYFKAQLENLSKFGANGHPALLNAFAHMPQAKQQQLSNPDNLLRILNASDEITLKSYLGRDANAEDIDNILAENARLATFKPIINAEIAKILAQAIAPNGLTIQNVEQINTLINRDSIYEDMVPGIHDVILNSGLDVQKILPAFGYNPDSLEYEASHPAFQKVTEQHNLNVNLLREKKDKSSRINKNLIELVLRVPKTIEFSNDQITDLQTNFNVAHNFQSFIDSFPNSTAEQRVFKNSLMLEFTPNSFNKLKINQQISSTIYQRTHLPYIGQALDELMPNIENLQKNGKSLAKSAELYSFVHSINSLNLSDAVLQSQNKIKAVRKDFEDLSGNCDATISQLIANRESFIAFKNSLEQPLGTTQEFRKVDEKRVKILKKVEDELIFLDKQLALFKEVQQKLSGLDGILPVLDDAAKGSINYFYNSNGFSISFDNEPAVASTDATSVTIGTSSRANLPFMAEEQFKDNARYNFSRTNGTVVTTGSFVETKPAATSSAARNGVNSAAGSQFIIDKTLVTNKKDTPVDPKDKADFYMAMAVAIVSRFKEGQGPTKDNPIRINGSNLEDQEHLWTALVVLGEKGPKNLRFDRDAISVDSGPFNPASQRQKKLGIERWAADSLYSTVYTNKDYAIPVGKKVEHMQKLSEAKEDHKEELKTAEKNMEKYKKKIGDIKELGEALNTRKAEVGTPVAEAPAAPAQSSIITPPRR